MSEDSDPYIPPRDLSPHPALAEEAAPETRPRVVKILGGLHLVLGIYTAVRLLGPALGYRLPHLVWVGGIPQLGTQYSRLALLRMRVNHRFHWLSPTATAFGDALALLLIVAGFMLLKRHKNAVRWSNAYAWVSIGEKIISTCLSVFLLGPAYREAYARSAVKVSAFQSATGFYLLNLLLLSLYPMVTLLLLNKPRIKAWFAATPI